MEYTIVYNTYIDLVKLYTPELVVHIRISLTEGWCQQGNYRTEVPYWLS